MLWTTRDVADLLGTSLSNAQTLSRRADFPKPARREGRTRYWNPDEVKAWYAADIPLRAKRARHGVLASRDVHRRIRGMTDPGEVRAVIATATERLAALEARDGTATRIP